MRSAKVVTILCLHRSKPLNNLDAIIDYSSAKTENQGQPWSPEHDRCLLDLHHKGVPVQEIAVTLKRGSGAVRSRLKKLGITES